MATVTTTLTPVQQYFSFTGYRDPQAVSSVDARAQVLAFIDAGDIAATGAGDNSRMLIDITLPQNFAWVMMDYCLQIQAATATPTVFNWDAQGQLFIADGATGLSNFAAPVGLTGSGEFSTAATARLMQIYKPFCPYSAIVNPVPGTSVFCRADFFNSTANDAAYKINLLARFLAYDITQVTDQAVNSPTPIR